MKIVQKIKERKLNRPGVQWTKKKSVIAVITAGVIVGLAVGGKILADRWQFQNYKVITRTELEDTTTTAAYAEFGDYVLKYGGDGATLLTSQGDEVWNDPKSMEYPIVAMRGQYCAIYDKKGTDIAVYNTNGKVVDIQTKLPVEKVCVNGQGITGVILADGETTWIRVYDQKGEELVTAKTSVDSPGYPVDLSLSDNGQLMAVSYLCVKDNQPASFMAFYNFGNTGQNQMDNQVSGYNYVGTLIPQVEYLNDSQALAFSDEGFLTYDGKQIPEESNQVSVGKDILSVFHDEQYVGLAYKTGKEKEQYEIALYTVNGKEKTRFSVDFAFDHVALSKNQVFVYNEKEVGIYTTKGYCRYRGTVKEGNVENIFRISNNRYMVILDSGTETIRLR